jgi:hypothetical protein
MNFNVRFTLLLEQFNCAFRWINKGLDNINPAFTYFNQFLDILAKLKSDYKLHHVCPTAHMNWAPSGQISMKFHTRVFSENVSNKPTLIKIWQE